MLSHIDLTIRKGETVAVMGATGSGKTTIVNLLMRFYEMESGEIYINEQNIRDVARASLRRNNSRWRRK